MLGGDPVSNFQPPASKIAWLERRLSALESMVRKVISPGGIVSGGTSSVTVLGVLEVHTHRGTGGGGTLDYKGTGSIASGATSATVTHGCGFTPTLQQISVTLGENPTNDPGIIWVDTIGATTFKVNCRADPGASNLDFGWRVSPT